MLKWEDMQQPETKAFHKPGTFPILCTQHDVPY